MAALVKKGPLLLRRRTLQLAALLLVALAVWAIVSTHTLLSHTVDEPTHISSGLEWLESGTQLLHPENPPLGRIGAGLGSFLEDDPLPSVGTAPQRGTELLYARDDYLRNLRRARLGTLPFFLLTVALVWNWANQIAGARAALLAAASLVSLPPLLGHAGLATTDVPFVAMFVLLVWTFVGWIETPTLGRSALLGLVLGLSVATKFSTLVFFPPAALAVLLVWRRRPDEGRTEVVQPDWARMLLGVVLLLPVVVGVVWAAYRFSVGPVDDIAGSERVVEIAFPDQEGLGRRVAESISHRSLPAPGALHGLYFLKAHTELGHPAYLLERRSDRGFWYFYPVVLLVKTPLGFLFLAVVAVVTLVRRGEAGGWRSLAPGAAAAAILVVSTISTINMGVRHVLIVYPLLALTIGLGIDSLLDGARSGRGRILGAAAALLLVGQASLLLRAHPDYLAYFNPLAGSEPGRVLVDSDLDWGQDALALEAALRELEVPRLHIAYFGSVRLCELDLPPLEWLPPGEPVSGWVAISEMYFRDHWRQVYDDPCDRTRSRRAPEGLSYNWLRQHEPVARAGRSIRIYRLDDV